MTEHSNEFADLSALLHRAFAAHAAADLDVVYQIRFGNTDAYYLSVHRGALQVTHGTHPQPRLRVNFDSLATNLDVLSGRLDPMQAFLEGRLQADGHIVLAMRMLQLFVPQYASTGPEQLR